VFVDGSNLFHRLRECGWRTEVDIESFAARLAGARELGDVFYYNVPPPRPNPRQDQYYARIENSQKVTFRLGYLQRRLVAGSTEYEEKGVDIALAVDMLTGAFEDKYDTAILVSSDGDFKPVVEAVQHLAKRVEYIYFRNARFSNALDQACDVARECRRAWAVLF
jgi:uncharacterized LabA/DUF88 family protein